MLINDEEMNKRLNNPLNLLNRMKSGLSSNKQAAMNLFVPSSEKKEKKEESTPASVVVQTEKDRVEVAFVNPFPKVQETHLVPSSKVTTPLPVDSPSSDEILDDGDAKIKLALAHDSALDLLTDSISSLKKRVNDGEIKASSLPSVIKSASSVISDIRKERLEREKGNRDIEVHHHFYCPEQKKITEYEVIDVAS